MDNKEWLNKINWELERRVLIFVSDEAPDGLYELPSEFGRYELTYPQRIYLTYTILTELLSEGLVCLEEYSSRESQYPSRIIEKEDITKILDNHYSWYPAGQPNYSIGATKEGIEYLDRLTDQEKKELHDRLFGKSK